MIILKGERVLLKALEREDCRQLWNAYQPAEPVPTEPLNPGLSIEGADDWFEEIQKKQGKDQFYLGIFQISGELLGDIQLSRIDWISSSAEMGMSISLDDDRNRGFGQEAARLLLKFAFQELNLNRIAAGVFSHNQSAIVGLTRIGFTEEAREREAAYIAGEHRDRIWFSILRSDFENLEKRSGSVSWQDLE